jgi:hypothetical protein
MKIKNIGDLKKYIADLPDSMEIKYYNGMVDDWHNVDVLETELIKEKPSFTLKLINAFNEREGKPLWDKLKKGSFKPRDWEFNEFIEEGLESFFKAARDFSARYSWMKPKIAFNTTMAIIAKASTHSCKNPETNAAPIKIQMIKSWNCPRKMASGLILFFS